MEHVDKLALLGFVLSLVAVLSCTWGVATEEVGSPWYWTAWVLWAVTFAIGLSFARPAARAVRHWRSHR